MKSQDQNRIRIVVLVLTMTLSGEVIKLMEFYINLVEKSRPSVVPDKSFPASSIKLSKLIVYIHIFSISNDENDKEVDEV